MNKEEKIANFLLREVNSIDYAQCEKLASKIMNIIEPTPKISKYVSEENAYDKGYTSGLADVDECPYSLEDQTSLYNQWWEGYNNGWHRR